MVLGGMSNKQSMAVISACVFVALFCAIYPLYVIRPFRAQSANELNLALFVMRIRPVLTLLCLCVAASGTVRLWRRRTGRPTRIAVASALSAVCLAAVAAHVNMFELMFHPVENPTFEPVAQVKLDADEMVLAVRPNGVARAYPIRAIAYHHVVNDAVGGVPVVATY